MVVERQTSPEKNSPSIVYPPVVSAEECYAAKDGGRRQGRGEVTLGVT